MSLKRRKFLIIGGLSGVGLTAIGKTLIGQSSQSANYPVKAVAKTPIVLAPKDPVLRFVAVADVGAGDRNQNAVSEAMTHYYKQSPYSLAVLAGDNIYTNGEMEKIGAVFEQPYATLLKQGVKFHACLGNHDIRSANGELQLRYAGYNMKGRHYTFREKSAQFFVLDTNTNADWDGQLTWLNQELSRSTAPWKIVYGHHPIYSSGHYGTSQEMVSLLTPIFKKHGVQLYINGHEHHYERTRPINGTTYLVAGIGGAHLRPVGRSQWTEYSVSRFGFAGIEVYSDRLEIQGIGTDDRVFDRGIVPIKSA
ncbi:MAG: metallophosphoesterase [Phormidesmis sp. CAN_BIN36]|nr:metallophosphoesterase [Phormidesmis sp. CAN_BIN36]